MKKYSHAWLGRLLFLSVVHSSHTDAKYDGDHLIFVVDIFGVFPQDFDELLDQ